MPRARFPELPADAVTGGLVLLGFYQDACAPCHALELRLEAFTRRHHGELDAYRIDIDIDMQTAREHDVTSIPTVLLVRNGEEVARLDGLITDQTSMTP
jgi:thioredoxin 1